MASSHEDRAAMSKLLGAVNTWRASSMAVLPLAFLQAFALSLDALPLIYFFRSIRCAQYEPGPHIPEVDVCRSPAVQRAYTADIALFTAIATVLSILLSGPYGTFSDLRGRKKALAVAVTFNGLGDIWMLACTLVPPMQKPWVLQLAAIFAGLGGSFAIVMAAQNAFIADTSAPAVRSYYMSLSLFMFWAGIAIGPLISAVMVDRGLFAANFGSTVGVWTVYLLYLRFVLRETRVPKGTAEDEQALEGAQEGVSHRKVIAGFVLRSVVEPVKLVFSRTSIMLPSLGAAGAALASGALELLVPYCDSQFGLRPSEAGIVTSVLAVSRAIVLLCVLPLFIILYRRIRSRSGAPSDAPQPAPVSDERTPLLAEQPAGSQPDAAAAETRKNELSIAQELFIARTCLLLDAVGVLAIWRSRRTVQVSLSTVLGSLGAPALPSMQALVTLAAPPGEVGRVLAGFSVLESLAVALRSPVFYPLFSATLETLPGAIWWLAAGIFVTCSTMLFGLSPRRFVRMSEARGA